jgi:hypothetical protein
MNRLAKRIAFSLPILLAILFPIYGRAKPHYTFVLPDGYVGWVQIIFNDPQASPLPIRKDGGRVIEVPESGMLRTSDIRVHDEKGRDEFYYRTILASGASELRPMPPEFALPGAGHGGWGVMDTGGKGRGYSWFIFLGPSDLRARTPWADITRVPGFGKKLMAPEVYPAPGRLPSTPSVKPAAGCPTRRFYVWGF